VVLRVGYTPVKGVFARGRRYGPGGDESHTDETYAVPLPRPADEPCTVPFPRPAYDDDQYPEARSHPEDDEL
jgi:hypothetical protein